MEQQFYEILNNFIPVYNTALALMKRRGDEDICSLIEDANVSVVNTDYDNWNGGTYGYTVYIGIAIKQYSSFSKDKISEIEKIISDSLNEAIKGDNNNGFYVQIEPRLTKEDIDWNIIGGISDKNLLKQQIETIRNIMVSVATNGSPIKDVEERYKGLHSHVQRLCKKLNITYYNQYSSLWDWYGKWKADFPTYQERRTYIKNLFEPTLAYFEDVPDSSSSLDTFVELDDWDRIKRIVTKIKRDCHTAVNAEDFQEIGLLCREVIISLAQAVYNPNLHGDKDENGVTIGNNDAVRMIGNYINKELTGSSNKDLRAYAKATNALTNRLTHERNATKRDMLLTVSSTIALINFIGVIAGKTI